MFKRISSKLLLLAAFNGFSLPVLAIDKYFQSFEVEIPIEFTSTHTTLSLLPDEVSDQALKFTSSSYSDQARVEWADNFEEGHIKLEARMVSDESCCSDFRIYTTGGDLYRYINKRDGWKTITGNISAGENSLIFVISFSSNPGAEYGLIDNIRYLSNALDSDSDFMEDAWENDHGLDSTNEMDAQEDVDGDGLENEWEYWLALDPNDSDTDNDGVEDGYEARFSLNPLDPADAAIDTDDDGLTNLEEFLSGTSPLVKDTDADGLGDAHEVQTSLTDPTEYDSDKDGYSDSEEIDGGTDPLDPASQAESLKRLHITFVDPLSDDWQFVEGKPWSREPLVNAYSGNYGLRAEFLEFIYEAELRFSHLFDQGRLQYRVRSNTDIESVRKISRIEVSGQEINNYYSSGWSSQAGWHTRSEDINQGHHEVKFIAKRGSEWVENYEFILDEIRFLSVTIDQDGDLMADPWEERMGFDSSDGRDAHEDPDEDGLINQDEYWAGTNPFKADTDEDGMPDIWEYTNNLDPLVANGPTADADGDTLTDLLEYEYDSNPWLADTDQDGVSDSDEVNTHSTNPLVGDSDGDGLNDGHELTVSLTNPLDADSDGDGAFDGGEIEMGYDPLDSDDHPSLITVVNEIYSLSANTLWSENADNLLPWSILAPRLFAQFSFFGVEEVPVGVHEVTWQGYFKAGTLDISRVSFGTTMSLFIDGEAWTDCYYSCAWSDIDLSEGFHSIVVRVVATEEEAGSIGGLTSVQYIANVADADYDSIPDSWEAEYGINASSSYSDQDGDGLSDRGEYKLGTNPIDPDYDSDGLPDGIEYKYKFDIYHAGDEVEDKDGDGLSNLDEYLLRTEMNTKDTDWDGLWDGAEVHDYGTSPLESDTDGDQLEDGYEVNTLLTNPLLQDTDEDTYPDNVEMYTNSDPLDADSLPSVIAERFYSFESGIGSDWIKLGDFEQTEKAYDGQYGITIAPGDWARIQLGGMFARSTLDFYVDTGDGGLSVNSGTRTYVYENDEPPGVKSIVVERGYKYIEFGFGAFNDDGIPPVLDAVRLRPYDADGDGLPDYWELEKGFNPLSAEDGAMDPDGDGLSLSEEYKLGTNYSLGDTDADGMDDYWEASYGTNPLVADSEVDADSDGLGNLEEYEQGTHPLMSDSDQDNMPDAWELLHELDPLTVNSHLDQDEDGLVNVREYEHDLDPNQADTDNDGLGDYWEVTYGTEPNTADAEADPDGDGLTNAQELTEHTDPVTEDTDADGMPDGWEVTFGLNPLRDIDADKDFDGDGLSNRQEYSAGSNPRENNSQETEEKAGSGGALIFGVVALLWLTRRYRYKLSPHAD